MRRFIMLPSLLSNTRPSASAVLLRLRIPVSQPQPASTEQVSEYPTVANHKNAKQSVA